MTGFAFQYATLRAVPRVDRGEFVNIGVILYCQALDYLAARIEIDDVRLRTLFSGVDLISVGEAAQAVVEACKSAAGSARQGDGLAYQFGMLTAPRSTVVQPSPIHAGITTDPAETLAMLVRRLVGS